MSDSDPTLDEMMRAIAPEDILTELQKLEADGCDGVIGFMMLEGPDPPYVTDAFRYRELREICERGLLDRLKNGEFEAHGHDSRSSLDVPRVRVPKTAWAFLKPDFEESRAEGRGYCIEDIRVAPTRVPRVSTALAENQCRTWLRAEAKSGRTGVTKATLKSEANSRFPGLSDRAFERVWKKAAPVRWKKPGRR